MTMPDTITPSTLRFERLLDAPIDKVWGYLTDPELRARWFMGGPTDLAVGGAVCMTMNHHHLSDNEVPTPERFQPFLGNSWEERITRIDPPQLLAFTWEGGEAGEVVFELAEEGGQTRLVLTHSGLRGRADAANFGGGWHSHLAALERRLRGKALPDFWALQAASEALVERALVDGG